MKKVFKLNYYQCKNCKHRNLTLKQHPVLKSLKVLCFHFQLNLVSQQAKYFQVHYHILQTFQERSGNFNMPTGY